MWWVNKKGRCFENGKPISPSRRCNILDEIQSKGGDKDSGIFPGSFVEVANKFEVSNASVSKLWRQYCETGTFQPKHGSGNRRSLSDGNIQLIEVLKTQECLYEFGDLPERGTSTTSLCNAVRYKLPSGQFSLKKVTTVAQERFTIGNMAHKQLFVDYLYGKDRYTPKYFDECGIKLANAGSRNYGHAKVGERAVDVRRYCQTVNVTLNLLCGITGVTYANTVNGPSSTLEYLKFFDDAFQSVDPNTGQPCLTPGDVIVMDNFPFHHNQGGEISKDFLSELKMELVYMPCYSPDFNPAEYVFGKIKTLMRYRLRDLTNANLYQSLFTMP